AVDGTGEVDELTAECLTLVVTLAEHGPRDVAVQAILRFFPADDERPGRAVNRQVGVLLLVDAPRQVNAAQHATGAADINADRILNWKLLHALALDSLHVGERAEEIAHQIDRVCAVVDEDPAAADGRIGVPALFHLDARGEDVLEQNHLAE